MFNEIAYRYDLLNYAMTCGMFQMWRNKLIKEARKDRPKKLLDVATGTCDVLIHALRNIPSLNEAIGIDISEEMLKEGYRKIRKAGLLLHSQLLLANAQKLPFSNNQFHVITTAFGVRNFENPIACYQEMYRVLTPKGKAVILELTEPRNIFLRKGYKLYTHNVLPFLGKRLAHNKNAYQYLYQSISESAQYENLCDYMRIAGFKNVKYQTLPLGIAALYIGSKL